MVCVLIAAAWCVSIGRNFAYEGVLSSGYSFYVGAGALWLSHSHPGLIRSDPTLRPSRPSQWDLQPDPQVQWWPAWDTYPWVPTGAVDWFGLPLWMPFVLVGIPTAWLWWQDRRRAREGQCAACGYDLAGLAAGAACPECGKADS